MCGREVWWPEAPKHTATHLSANGLRRIISRLGMPKRRNAVTAGTPALPKRRNTMSDDAELNVGMPERRNTMSHCDGGTPEPVRRSLGPWLLLLAHLRIANQAAGIVLVAAQPADPISWLPRHRRAPRVVAPLALTVVVVPADLQYQSPSTHSVMSGFRRSQLPQNIDLGPDMLFKDLHVGHCHTPSCAAMSAFGDRLREGLRLRDGLGEDGGTPELFDVVGGAPELSDVERGNGALQLSTAVGCCIVEDDEDAGTSGRRYRGDLKRGRRRKGDLEHDRERKAA